MDVFICFEWQVKNKDTKGTFPQLGSNTETATEQEKQMIICLRIIFVLLWPETGQATKSDSTILTKVTSHRGLKIMLHSSYRNTNTQFLLRQEVSIIRVLKTLHNFKVLWAVHGHLTNPICSEQIHVQLQEHDFHKLILIKQTVLGTHLDKNL